MRALAPLALLALALPGAQALAFDPPSWQCIPEAAVCPGVPELPEVGWMCVPENPVCMPLDVACPRLGGTAGWCARVVSADVDGDGLPESLLVTLAAGDHHGPRLGAFAGAGLLTYENDPVPGLAGLAGIEADACRVTNLPDAPSEVAELPCGTAFGIDAAL